MPLNDRAELLPCVFSSGHPITMSGHPIIMNDNKVNTDIIRYQHTPIS